MSVLEAEAKARTEYKANPNKVLSKLSFSYCQRKALIPYEMTNEQFDNMINNYLAKFPNGTILDALWAYNGECKTKPTSFPSRIPLAMGQIAELEGRYEIALRNLFECVVLEIVQDLSEFKTLSPYHKEWNNDPLKFLRRGGSVDYLKKGSISGDRISQIVKKSSMSEKEIFEMYKYIGSIPPCCLTTEQINSYILDSIVE